MDTRLNELDNVRLEAGFAHKKRAKTTEFDESRKISVRRSRRFCVSNVRDCDFSDMCCGPKTGERFAPNGNAILRDQDITIS